LKRNSIRGLYDEWNERWIYTPFKKVNVKEEINRRLENDDELKKAYDYAQHEYEIIKQLVKMRNEMGLTQSDVAIKSGLTQQMVSRIETIGNSPTLKNFIKYVDSLGLEIKLEKKNAKMRYSKT
jgi:DNA-binding XRE family transcriptional regulator